MDINPVIGLLSTILHYILFCNHWAGKVAHPSYGLCSRQMKNTPISQLLMDTLNNTMLKHARYYDIDLNNESLSYVKDFNYLGIKGRRQNSQAAATIFSSQLQPIYIGKAIHSS